VFVEVMLDPFEVLGPKAASKRLPDGSMVSEPLIHGAVLAGGGASGLVCWPNVVRPSNLAGRDFGIR